MMMGRGAEKIKISWNISPSVFPKRPPPKIRIYENRFLSLIMPWQKVRSVADRAALLAVYFVER